MPRLPRFTYELVPQDDALSDTTLEVDEFPSPSKARGQEHRRSAAEKLLLGISIGLGLILGCTVASATLNACAIMLSHWVFLSDMQPYSSLNRGVIVSLAYLGALIQCATAVPIVAFCGYLIGEKHVRVIWTLRFAVGLLLCPFPFAVGAAVLPRAVPAGFDIAHAFQLCGWAFMPLAILVGVFGALAGFAFAMESCCLQWDRE
ncbi:hypothetical protein BV20DRAFT_974417 [Pilatotrama ljubarskyi]|nr:hypothetical protein BV20DRAFT_974417 [Pilatotrama ljubarskyi]